EVYARAEDLCMPGYVGYNSRTSCTLTTCHAAPCLDDRQPQGLARCAVYVKRELLQAEVPVADLVGRTLRVLCRPHTPRRGGHRPGQRVHPTLPTQGPQLSSATSAPTGEGLPALRRRQRPPSGLGWPQDRPTRQRGPGHPAAAGPGDTQHRGCHLPPSRSPGHQHSHRPQRGHGGLPVRLVAVSGRLGLGPG
ncbi:hypothetical protein MTO96_047132, partial [Rhipicephalus appendiculatus]